MHSLPLFRKTCILLCFAVALAASACSGSNASPARPTPSPPSATETREHTQTASPTPAPAVRTTSESFRDAAALLREGSYEAAAAAYITLSGSSSDPQMRAEASLGASVAKFQSGDSSGATLMLRSALAAAPPGTAVRRRSAYLLAVRLNEANANDEPSGARDALFVLQPFVQSPVADALQPYLLAEYARALDATGESATAATTWDTIFALPALPPALRNDGYRARAAAARTSGNTVATRLWLTKLASATGDPATRYELATLALNAGDNATFASQLQAILADSPASQQAPAALIDLKSAGVAVDPGDEGLVYYRRGLYADAKRVLTDAIAEPGLSPLTLAFRTFYLAAANEDSGNAAEAVRYYDSVAALGAVSPYTHRAKYWAARVTEGAGDSRSAANQYAELVANGPSGAFTTESAFRAGYALLRAGDPAAAVATWSRLGVSSDARLLYWQGRAYTQLKDDASARQAYARAADVAPLDFYGIEGARQLGRGPTLDVSYRPRTLSTTIDWPTISTWLAGVFPGEPVSVPTGATDFTAVGLRERGSEVILDAADGAGPWKLLDLARQAHDAGLVAVSARLAVRLRQATGVPAHEAPPALMRLSYPVDYVALLSKESRLNGIDPLFMAAVIRQESFWDAGAGSPAGALGLTQVIPPTGEAIAASLGVNDFKPEDLFRPVVSLRFGASYLGGQLKRYENPLAALAAYNAGPSNASRWLSALPANANAADFAETVDFDETQHYVQVILEHYAFYQKAYGP